MIGRRKFIVLVSAGTLAAGGTVAVTALLPGERQRSGSPVLRFGAEQCTYCGMIISDPQFAAAWREAGGREQHFDDIGCMVNASRRRDPGAGTEWWVHDYGSSAWLAASEAAYAFSDSIKTPMAYGVAAFARAEDARSLIRTSGTVRTWDETLKTVERKS
jgi:copper chaperone NosL